MEKEGGRMKHEGDGWRMEFFSISPPRRGRLSGGEKERNDEEK